MSAGLAAVVLVLAGCGGDGDGGGEATNLAEGGATTSSTGGTATTTPGAACEVEGGVSTKGSTEVTTELSEWKITAGTAQATPGIVSFLAENVGAEPHELVIVKGDSAESLPKDADGAMDEEQLAEGALVGEIEPMAAGQLCRGNFAMTAGKYVLLCNIVETEDDGTKESHYAEGMFTSFSIG